MSTIKQYNTLPLISTDHQQIMEAARVEIHFRDALSRNGAANQGIELAVSLLEFFPSCSVNELPSKQISSQSTVAIFHAKFSAAALLRIFCDNSVKI